MAPKTEITASLSELKKLNAKKKRAEKKLEKELEPHLVKLEKAQEAYESATEHIREKHEGGIAETEGAISTIVDRINSLVLARKKKDGTPTIQSVAGSGYLVRAAFSERREVRVRDFLKKFGRKLGSYECVKVTIGKAEKLVGKTELEKVCDKSKTWRVEIEEA